MVADNTVPVDLDALIVSGPSLFGIDKYLAALIPVDPTTLVAGAPIQVVAPYEDTDEEVPLSPDGATIGGTLWLSVTCDRELVRVDPATGAVVGRVPVDAYPGRITRGHHEPLRGDADHSGVVERDEPRNERDAPHRSRCRGRCWRPHPPTGTTASVPARPPTRVSP